MEITLIHERPNEAPATDNLSNGQSAGDIAFGVETGEGRAYTICIENIAVAGCSVNRVDRVPDAALTLFPVQAVRQFREVDGELGEGRTIPETRNGGPACGVILRCRQDPWIRI